LKTKTVSELMVPLSEYATVSEEATLYDAILALEKTQEEFNGSEYKHRAILVFNTENKIVGKVSQLDILRSLEPKYDEMTDSSFRTRFGLSQNFIRSMIDQYKLWDLPLSDICRKAAQHTVKSFMYKPGDGELVEEDASLDAAVHQLVMGHHQSLLVTRGEEIIGILRLTDVFKEICQVIKVNRPGFSGDPVT